MKLAVSCFLVFIMSCADVKAQHRKAGTCALNVVREYENGVINMEVTPNQPCPSNPGSYYRNIIVDPPSSTIDYYLISDRDDSKIHGVLLPKDSVDTVELGNKISHESAQCKRCRLYKYEGQDDIAKFYCYPIEECPSRIAGGVFWEPPVAVAFTKPSLRCFYDVCGETDIYYCEDLAGYPEGNNP
ncbi:uncharacterized protein [Ptychodera flava]|uniref:uncharacterized protein n=1 Tax=Ptychodera flava TaxID=63121 RepID=UPI003969E4AB